MVSSEFGLSPNEVSQNLVKRWWSRSQPLVQVEKPQNWGHGHNLVRGKKEMLRHEMLSALQDLCV